MEEADAHHPLGAGASADEVGKEYDPLMGPGGGDELPLVGQPVRDVAGQISGTAQSFDVPLHNGGGQPFASRSGHGRRRSRRDARTWVLELESAHRWITKEEEGVGKKGGSLSPYIWADGNYVSSPA